VTICSAGRVCLFGDISNNETVLNELGEIVEEEWRRSGVIRREVEMDVFVVMPNHLHGIVFLGPVDEVAAATVVGASGRSPHRARGPSREVTRRVHRRLQGIHNRENQRGARHTRRSGLAA